MKSSFMFDNDEFVFEVYYTYEKGMSGDGYLQPDDPDVLEYDEIYLIGSIDEDCNISFLKNKYDVQNILSRQILNEIEYAMNDDVENNEYFL